MKEIVITSSVLVVALLILRVLFAKKVRRAWIYGAWLLVAVRLLLPVQIGQLPFSILTPAQPITEAIGNIAAQQIAGVTEQDAHRQVLQDYIEEDLSVFHPEVQEQIQNAVDEDIPKDEIASMIDKAYPEAEIYLPEIQAQVQQKVQEKADPITLGQIVTWVWLIGVAIMMIWLAVGNLLLGRSLRKTEKTMKRNSPIPVYVSKAAVSPCLVGLFSPAVYLTPESAADETVMRHVLAHELTHYAHKDHIWALVRCVCLCVYWFHPLVWVAAWLSRRDCELACDEGALERLGEEERIAYGRSLLQVVSQTTVPGRLMLTATTMAETKKQLRQRVNFIANKPKWSMIAAVSMALICVLITGCVATGPVEMDSGETHPSETGPTEAGPTETNPSQPPNIPIGKPWEVSEEVKQQLKQEYIEHVSDELRHDCTAEDVELVVISQVDSGYAVVIGCKCNSLDLEPSWEDLFNQEIGDFSFYTPKWWYFRFCKDGEFRDLEGAYGFGWINYEQMRAIWNDYYYQFPKAYKEWKRANPGLDEPPLRDPSLLDYRVNEDGKTCTITGPGAYKYPDVVIPETIAGYQVTAIGERAFYHKGIASITMPDSIVSVGKEAFWCCDNLKSVTLSASLETIGAGAFRECKSLETIVLPNGIISIEPFTFEDCEQLKSITLSNCLETIGLRAFKGCKALEEIHLPGSLTDIDSGAFSDCSSLTAVTVPSGVTVIKGGVFASCFVLKYVSLEGEISSIGAQAFQDCASLTQFVIPDKVTEIGESAFKGCANLRQIQLPNGLISIGKEAFRQCLSLEQVVIPRSVQTIGLQAFDGSLRRLEVSEGNLYYAGKGNCLIEIQSGTLVFAAQNPMLPTDGSVRRIGEKAFLGHTELREIVLPEGLESIGYDAFSGCSNLTRVVIPTSVSLLDCAFSKCEKLKIVDYRGILGQWRHIRQVNSLFDIGKEYTVRCADGEIKVEK